MLYKKKDRNSNHKVLIIQLRILILCLSHHLIHLSFEMTMMISQRKNL